MKTWEIPDLVKADYRNKLYYVYDKIRREYILYVRANRIKSLVIRQTDYTNRNLSRLEEALFQKKINSSEVYILNFLSHDEDFRTIKTLSELFPNNHSDFSFENFDKIKKDIKSKRIKYLFCMGHYDAGEIFTHAQGSRIEYGIDLLKNIGKTQSVEIFFLGCESSLAAGGGMGTTTKINSVKMLNELFKALKVAKSLGDLYVVLSENTPYGFALTFDENFGLIKIEPFDFDDPSFSDATTSLSSSNSSTHLKHLAIW